MPGIKKIPNLVQGVSQQAPSQSRDTQCAIQFDCWNSPEDGCVARPGFNLVAMYDEADWSDAALSLFFRDDERYVIGFNADTPLAINLDSGVEATITEDADDTYAGLGSLTNREGIRIASVEDTTFVVNIEAVPAMTADVTADQDPFAYVVFTGTYLTEPNYDYYVSLEQTEGGSNSYSANLNPPNGSESQTGSAQYLASSINTATGTHGFSASSPASVVRIERTDGYDFSLFFDDHANQSKAHHFKTTCPAFEKLPFQGFDGDIIYVKGENAYGDDDYYVQWSSTSSNYGTWEETVGPGGVHTTIDQDTMPHRLVCTGLNAFTYEAADWSTRIVGDEESAKDPSFIGQPVLDIFYHANRLALLTEAACTWSKDKFPYTFFPDTVQTVLDTGPVDISDIRSANTRGTARLSHHIEIDESLLLWGQRQQYVVKTGEDNIFKPGAVSAKPSTSFEFSPAVGPVINADGVMFSTDISSWVKLRVLPILSGAKTAKKATTLTSHVNRYIEGPAQQLSVSDAINAALIRGGVESSTLNVYNYLLREDGEYIQSAWNKWRLPHGFILWAEFVDGNIYLLQQRSEGVALLSCDLTPALVDADAGATYLTRLDLRVDETDCSNLAYASGSTTFDLPYEPDCDPADFLVVTRADRVGGHDRGRLFPVTDITGTQVTVTGDLTDYDFYAGYRITAQRRETTFFLREEDGVVPMDRLTVIAFSLIYSETGYTRVECNGKYVSYEGYSTGQQTGTDTPTIGGGQMTLGIGLLAKDAVIEIINDSHLPSRWQSAAYDWDGTPTGRGGSR